MRTAIVLLITCVLCVPLYAQNRYRSGDGRLRVATDEGGLSIAAMNRMIAGAVRGVAARQQ